MLLIIIIFILIALSIFQIISTHYLIGVEGGDSEGISETDETSQRTRSGGEGSSLTPWKASA